MIEAVTANGNKLSKRLYGTTLSKAALYGSNEIAEYWADLVYSLRMNVVRIHHEDNIQDYDRFFYLLSALKQRGIYWVIPAQTVHQNGDYTSVSRRQEKKTFIDQLYGTVNPYTGMTIGADPALAFVEISNEASAFRDTKPDDWGDLTLTARTGYVDMIDEIEKDYFGDLSAHIGQHTNALLIGSQANYQLQNNNLDLCDHHFYINRPHTAVSPWTFDNKMFVDDNNFWPLAQTWNRDPSKPFGCTEANDAGPSWYYHTNLLTMLAIAGWQDWSWFIHFHLSNGEIPKIGKISGNLRDDGHTGKKEILKLGARMFLGGEITPTADPVGYAPVDYLQRVIDKGFVEPFQLGDTNFDTWAPIKGSAQIMASLNNPLQITTPNIDVDTYEQCDITEKKQLARCENVDMVWVSKTEYTDWGQGPVNDCQLL